MTRDFAQHRAIAAADDQDMLGVAVSQQRHVGHHFVIDKLIAFGGLHDAIQRHHPAKGAVVKDDQILMIGFFVVQHVINAKVLTKMVMQRFMPQWIIGHGEAPPSLTSVTPVKRVQHHRQL